MYKEDFIQQLKQNNVSDDIEKTKQRMNTIWKNASKEDRQTVMNLAGVALSTMQRVYKTGSISAKLIVPLSQTLDINPLYLTGESDEMDGCDDEVLRNFLIACGYQDLLITLDASTRKKRGRTPKSALLTEPEAEVVTEAAPVQTAEEVIETVEEVIETVEADETENEASEPATEFLDCMTEEDMILLLRAVLLRAKAGGKGAELANKLKSLLLGLE